MKPIDAYLKKPGDIWYRLPESLTLSSKDELAFNCSFVSNKGFQILATVSENVFLQLGVTVAIVPSFFSNKSDKEFDQMLQENSHKVLEEFFGKDLIFSRSGTIFGKSRHYTCVLSS
jgi:hypothetical protein